MLRVAIAVLVAGTLGCMSLRPFSKPCQYHDASPAPRLVRSGAPDSSLGDSGVLVVRVTDGCANAPLPFASIDVTGPDSIPRQATADDAAVRRLALPSGGHSLRVRLFGYAPARSLVMVRSGFRDTLLVEMWRSQTRLH
jgi:hypothetical protein